MKLNSGQAFIVFAFLCAWVALPGCSSIKVVVPETDFNKIDINVGGMHVYVYEFYGDDNPCIGGIGACNAIIGDSCYVSVPAGNSCLLKHELKHCGGWDHWGTNNSECS